MFCFSLPMTESTLPKACLCCSLTSKVSCKKRSLNRVFRIQQQQQGEEDNIKKDIPFENVAFVKIINIRFSKMEYFIWSNITLKLLANSTFVRKPVNYSLLVYNLVL